MLVFISYVIPILIIFFMYLLIRQSNRQRLVESVVFQNLLLILLLWIISLWIADQIDIPNVSIIFLRIALSIGSIIPTYLFIFVERFSGVYKKSLTKLIAAFSLFFAVISFTNLMLTKIEHGLYGVQIHTYSLLYTLQTVFTVFIFIFCFLWLSYYKNLYDGQKKLQVKIMNFGLFGSLFIGVSGGYLLRSSGSNLLLPIAVTLFAFSIFIAILKHGLFDVKIIIARSIAYIGSLISLGLIFVTITFIVTNNILKNESHTVIQWAYTVVALFLAFIFQPIKKFFDKVTKKLFFQDSYDIQTFLDNFNKVIVSSFDLEVMLKNITDIIENNLKPSYCLFGIKEDGDRPRRIIGSKNHPEFTEEEIAFVRKLTPTMKRKVIVTDLLEDKYKDLQAVLQKNNISIIARLATSLREEGVGYIVLGPKKSGNMYNSQDIKVLDIIANELVIAIQNSLRTEEIENFNLTLQERVRTATNKLRNTNDKLRALDEAKDDFVSMASHQLRTPLTSVKGNISLVLDGDAGKITSLQRQLLEQAFTSSQRMVYLIADLLNVSRLKTGKFMIEAAPVDFPSIVEDEVNQLIDTAKSRHLVLSFRKPEHITTLMLDETKTRQVIMNFIDNAIYYTPAGGRIDVVLTETDTAVELRVIDNGIGVPSREQHHLFTKFYRAGNARKARPDGTGLGLFMAKKVIIAEGGSIIFQTQEGQGSTFGFSFPKASLSQENFKSLPSPQEQAVSTV